MFKEIVNMFMRKRINGISKPNDNFFKKLIKEDTNVSMMNFFLICTLAIGCVLLLIPAIGLIVDIIFNHTITINMSDLAVYIGSVAGIFAAGGLSSAWTEFSYSKYNVPIISEEENVGTNIEENNGETQC